jgi:glycosyltransferase involved in cell wall biosynthesis
MTARLCLNMIVKNEAANIERCLASLASVISAWVICDTGSTDDTPDRIERFFAARGIAGELHRFPFVNFGLARNEALDRCRGSALEFDYILFADADMELVVEDQSFLDRLSAVAYLVQQRAGISYDNVRLLRRDAQARYVGATHEYLDIQGDRERLAEIWYIDHASGSNRIGKFERDARLLEEDLVRDPDNARSVFYLAQSYRDAGDLTRARETYRQRVALGGWEEEVWYSLHEIGRLNERLGSSVAEIRSAYLDAYQFRPRRAEPLYQLARFHRERSEWSLASLFAQQAAAIPRPADDILFVDDSVYLWRSLDELGVAAYWAGQRAEGKAATERVLAEGHVPASERPRIESNLGFYLGNADGTPDAGGVADQPQSRNSPSRAFRRRILFALGDNYPGGSGYLRGVLVAEHMAARMGWTSRILDIHEASDPARFESACREFEPDVVLLQRAFAPHQHPDRLRPAIVIIDLDDALFLRTDMAAQMESAVSSAHAFVAGNRFIGEWGKRFNANVQVIHTCGPMRAERTGHRPRDRQRIVAWPHSAPFDYPEELELVGQVLVELRKRCEFTFRLYGSNFSYADGLTRKEPWLKNMQQQRVTVSLMPSMPYAQYVASLEEVAVGMQPIVSEWSKGKSFGKLLACMSSEAAVVCSDAADHAFMFNGSNGILARSVSDWVEGIRFYLESPADRERAAEIAYRDYCEKLTTPVAAQALEGVISALR